MARAQRKAQPAKDPLSEVRRNYEAFMEKLPDLIATPSGKFALMHQANIVEFFDTAGDAYRAGKRLYGEGAFSIQEVTEAVSDLGFMSHALPQR